MLTNLFGEKGQQRDAKLVRAHFRQRVMKLVRRRHEGRVQFFAHQVREDRAGRGDALRQDGERGGGEALRLERQVIGEAERHAGDRLALVDGQRPLVGGRGLVRNEGEDEGKGEVRMKM
jgi:hypothetical protein